jgi:hypothetical protein
MEAPILLKKMTKAEAKKKGIQLLKHDRTKEFLGHIRKEEPSC